MHVLSKPFAIEALATRIKGILAEGNSDQRPLWNPAPALGHSSDQAARC
ncbi:MAG: hypothetical protein ACJ8AW_48620 [Rhodopila sp.]